jgi:hypothetical protein
MDKKKLILMVIGGIFYLIGIIKLSVGFYLRELPLFFGLIIVGSIFFFIASKIKAPSSEALSLEGIWLATDGSTKIFGSNGICQNMMDVANAGSQTYVLSSDKDSDGRYTLRVSQSPNERTLYVKDSGEGKVNIFDGGENLLWTMTKKMAPSNADYSQNE